MGKESSLHCPCVREEAGTSTTSDVGRRALENDSRLRVCSTSQSLALRTQRVYFTLSFDPIALPIAPPPRIARKMASSALRGAVTTARALTLAAARADVAALAAWRTPSLFSVGSARTFSAAPGKPAGGAAPSAPRPSPAPSQSGARPGGAGAGSGAGPSTSPSASAAAAVHLPKSAPISRPTTLVLQLKLRSYHHFYLNQFVVALQGRLQSLGLPRPSQAFLPKKIQRWTVLRSPHVDKKARDQFERISHKRVVTINMPPTPPSSSSSSDASNVELAYRLLRSLSNIAAGVEVRARYLSSTGARVLQ
jgi:small subunit ribosomal protein S10